MQVVEVNGKRYYLIDGRKYPSVTTVLSIIRSPALELWRGELGNVEADRIRDEAAEIGIQLHRACYLFNKLQVPNATVDELPPNSMFFAWPSVQVEQMFAAYRRWFDTCVEAVVATEVQVFNRQYGYAGTVDLLAILKGDEVPSVIDLKTTSGFWPDQPLQLAAYREAWIQNELQRGALVMSKNACRRLVVRIDKVEHDSVVVKEHTEHQRDFNGFLAALSLFRYFNR